MNRSSIFLSAGDPSGDNASARLISELNKIAPGLKITGLGGPRLKKLGQTQLAEGNELAVLGFWEVARRFRFFRTLLSRCADNIRNERPSVVLLVDYPGFNLRLAKRIKATGIPIIYYISPQVWAWGGKRIYEIERLVDLMILILPFEREFYRPYNVDHKFVGHYLLEDIPADYISSEIPGGKPAKLALLPGSRPQEIERMLPPMIQTARMFNQQHGTTAEIAAVSGIDIYSRYLGNDDTDTISLRYDQPRQLIHESSVVVTASGTATLETAIIGRPMVVMYKTGFLTYQIARRLVRLDNIALVNLVLGERVVPELIQQDATPERTLDELNKFWQDESYFDSVRRRLNKVPSLLGGEGASKRTAQLIAEYL